MAARKGKVFIRNAPAGVSAPCEDTPKILAEMLCGTSIADLEAKLSAALTASMRVPAEYRPSFIAYWLLDTQSPVPYPELTEKPPNLDAEINALTALIREAVNSASRQPDDPLPNIASYLMRTHGDNEDEVDELEEEPVPDVQPKQLPRRPASSTVQKKRDMRDLRAALGLGKNSCTPPRKTVPVLGHSASSVLPAVIGAFQDEQSKKATKRVDMNIIDMALEAGAVNELARQQERAEEEARKHKQHKQQVGGYSYPTSK